MAEKTLSHHETINEALQLDGGADSIKTFYRDWADRYDRDVEDTAYAAPELAAEFVAKSVGSGDVSDLKILDAGCGTGLVGQQLRQRGFTNIDGFDLSPDMADVARRSGAYREVAGDIDLLRATETYGKGSYDVVISIGVFTLGHVPPTALAVLKDLARPGGLVVVSTRTLYFDQSDYRQVSDGLVADGALTLVECVMDAPYNDDGLSHYWVYRVGPALQQTSGGQS